MYPLWQRVSIVCDWKIRQALTSDWLWRVSWPATSSRCGGRAVLNIMVLAAASAADVALAGLLPACVTHSVLDWTVADEVISLEGRLSARCTHASWKKTCPLTDLADVAFLWLRPVRTVCDEVLKDQAR